MKNSRLVGAIASMIVLLMATLAFGQSSTTFNQTVNKATLINGTNFVLTSSANPSVYGSSVTFTSTLTASGGGAVPTGTVQFLNNGVAMGTPVALTAGVATYSISSLAVGTYPITAQYSGDTNYNSATSSTLSQVVTKAVLTVTANNATKVYAAALPSFSPTYSGFVNGDTSAVLTGSPSLTTTATAASPVGTYTITAAVGTLATPNYTFAYVNGTLTITTATLNIAANNASRAYDVANPAFTATYTGFVNGDTSASLTTQPTLTTTAVLLSPTGTYPITAAGAVDANYTITYTAGTLTIGKTAATVTVVSSANPSAYGANVTFTATLPATATGSVMFLDNGVSIGTGAISAGTATLSSSTLGVGTHPITVSYAGDGNFTAATSATLSQVVTLGSVTFAVVSSANPSTYGSPVTLTITTTGSQAGVTPTGTLTVSDSLGWTAQTIPLVSGVATLTTSTLPAGTNTLTIVYNGDVHYQIIKGTGAITSSKAATKQ
jgi:hypothetical protein